MHPAQHFDFKHQGLLSLQALHFVPSTRTQPCKALHQGSCTLHNTLVYQASGYNIPAKHCTRVYAPCTALRFQAPGYMTPAPHRVQPLHQGSPLQHQAPGYNIPARHCTRVHAPCTAQPCEALHQGSCSKHQGIISPKSIAPGVHALYTALWYQAPGCNIPAKHCTRVHAPYTALRYQAPEHNIPATYCTRVHTLHSTLTSSNEAPG